VGATAGVFELGPGANVLSSGPQFWGRGRPCRPTSMCSSPTGSTCSPRGTLQINLTDSVHVETLTLPGIGPGGTAADRHPNTPPGPSASRSWWAGTGRDPRPGHHHRPGQAGRVDSPSRSTRNELVIYATRPRSPARSSTTGRGTGPDHRPDRTGAGAEPRGGRLPQRCPSPRASGSPGWGT